MTRSIVRLQVQAIKSLKKWSWHLNQRNSANVSKYFSYYTRLYQAYAHVAERKSIRLVCWPSEENSKPEKTIAVKGEGEVKGVWDKNWRTLPPLPYLSDCLVQARRYASTHRSQINFPNVNVKTCFAIQINSGFIDRASACIIKLFPVRAPEFPKPLRFSSLVHWHA